MVVQLQGKTKRPRISVETPAVLAHSAERSQIGGTAQRGSGLQNRRSRVKEEPITERVSLRG